MLGSFSPPNCATRAAASERYELALIILLGALRGEEKAMVLHRYIQDGGPGAGAIPVALAAIAALKWASMKTGGPRTGVFSEQKKRFHQGWFRDGMGDEDRWHAM
ncbi:unnamed protein product [Tuber aestivum]|uniref:Uncharacterized protein n=1 Tax=Tuber aestivum TaxID=59557 RepID=A0A292PUQ4_9PEZI|nr:unnamed protein product [Tuber aestivum]